MRVPEYFTGIPAHSTDDYRDLLVFCEAHRTAVLASLPWFAAEIAGRESFHAMFAIQRVASGRRFYVPADRAVVEARLGVEISEATFDALRRAAAPSLVIDIPSSWGIFTAIRRAGVFIAIRNELRADFILRRFGITNRVLKTYQRQIGENGHNSEA